MSLFGLEPLPLAATLALTLFAGFVKGAVGFAQPMILISGLAGFLPPETALAALIVPTVTSNLWQALRNGAAAAWDSVRRFRVYLGVLVAFIALSAQLVRVLPAAAMLLMLGVPIVLFTLAQLLGWHPRLPPRRRVPAEVLVGAASGFVGGLSGVWGPPTVMLLAALDTPKAEAMRVQGVIYGVGAVALLLGHLRSGVLNAQTLPLSVALVVPSLAGMALGFALHDRLDQRRFRQMMLVVLLLAGLNLIRRGLA